MNHIADISKMVAVASLLFAAGCVYAPQAKRVDVVCFSSRWIVAEETNNEIGRASCRERV